MDSKSTVGPRVTPPPPDEPDPKTAEKEQSPPSEKLPHQADVSPPHSLSQKEVSVASGASVSVAAFATAQRKYKHINLVDDGRRLTLLAFPCLEPKLKSGEIIDTGKRDSCGRVVFALGSAPTFTFVQTGLPEGFIIDIDFHAPVSGEDDSREADFFWSETGTWCNGDVKAVEGRNLGHVDQKGLCVVMDGQTAEGHYKDWSMAWWNYHCSKQAHYPQPSYQHHHKKGKRGPVDPALAEKKISESLLGEVPGIRYLLCSVFSAKEIAKKSWEQYDEQSKSGTAPKHVLNKVKQQRDKDRYDFKTKTKELKLYIKLHIDVDATD